LPKCERGCEYSFTSKGCDFDGAAVWLGTCAEGALGTDEDEASCAHPAGTIVAASNMAQAR